MDGDLGLRLGVEAGHVPVVMVLAGQYYDQTTGVTTYRPENVEGNWQTYFFDFHSMSIDKKRQLMLDNYMHGDYTRNVDINNDLTANYNIKRDSESHALRWLQGHSTKTVFFHRKNLFIMQIFYTFAPVFEGHSILSDSEKCLLTEKAKNYLYQPLKIL